MVGEPANRRCAGRHISRDTRDAPSGLGPAGNPIERRVDGFEELDTESGPPALVPDGRIFELEGTLQARFGRDESSFGQPPGDAIAHILPRFAG